MTADTYCARCGNGGILIRGRTMYLCRDCFYAGPGQRWPWPQVVPFRANEPLPEWRERR